MGQGKQSRRERLERVRAEQRRRERRQAALIWGIGGLVTVVIITLAGFAVVTSRAERSLAEVQRFSYRGGDHSWTKVSYKETPPVGGTHNYVWQNCGIYDKPIHDELAVHSLEHGAVWITYRPDLPESEVNKLKELASADYMLLSPYPGLSAKIMVTSWNHQLKLDRADDPRLPEFIKTYKQNPKHTPEFGAACTGGLSITADQPLPTPDPEIGMPGKSPSPSASAEPPATPSPLAS
ncbi:hypothetical protein TBS_02160 [Thermobispora bispora]|mgnify:CR=1 FL=1|jgi:hypothetical protein|uniref:DUF3105 domain-containing protein n=1 Tax=Thermobispora bispora (strain ATCC 19993 / DSM 43833 / CBS 139.67 / JCM 10125 / KCTC 9307 / NBRC 14880 / R51) TaxID=469371 RepID=D6Y8R0_THEBD|nr:DUF3105 domain-containing protein [Thermobispora bispora]MBO2474262.1 DUF3105 domain-containing protein [Actinomycetales bacterium]MDI9581640.1 DUF3105 domain-containing protein [Thermobispora sp.]ADG87957.1 hypothetical protein Tbis_1238 [Thermobispora bispora DSM 43833]MBX6168470.1 DUF3105 domain-containing protein [Thermobispora bispora]QSI47829.1 DUF3105 domain-containing protein [Thermobispora bispora]